MCRLLDALLVGCSVAVASALGGCGGVSNDVPDLGSTGGSDAGNGTGGIGAGGGASGGQSSGGSAGSGGAVSTGGAAGAGGNVCGPCPGLACFEGIRLTIAPSADAAAVLISHLDVTAPGLTFTCTTNLSPCEWFCNSVGSVPDGDYTVSVSAPGFQTSTLAVHAVSPTDCGCCGCCGFGTFQTVILESSGNPPAGGCCANLDSDGSNCGACGHACPSGSTCTSGKCSPSSQGCLTESDGFATCDAYCKSTGQVCSPSCVNGIGAFKWTSGGTCAGTYQPAACGDGFQPAASYACCCGAP